MDDGEMPPLEGAEEDASRMEEVSTTYENWLGLKMSITRISP